MEYCFLISQYRHNILISFFESSPSIGLLDSVGAYTFFKSRRTMKRLENKVALVTGASYGIGFEVARRLATEGAKVVICSRKEENVEAAVEKLRQENLDVFGVKCHIGNKLERGNLLEQTIQKYGQLDILVSNVATNPAIKYIFDTEESEWDHLFDINVKSSFMLAKEALPHLRKRIPGANIVFISSIVAVSPLTYIGAYSITKTALLGLTKVASGQLAMEGIRVNCVAPGPIDTPFLRNIKQAVDLSWIGMRRFGSPEEISGVVAFLVSDDASYITGETIVAAFVAPSRL